MNVAKTEEEDSKLHIVDRVQRDGKGRHDRESSHSTDRMSNSMEGDFDHIPLQPGHKIIISMGSGNPEGSLIDSTTTKCSVRGHGQVLAYAVNTHQGIVRGYNEDRVSIVLNILKPPNRPASEDWPKCSFFGVYDGHGGAGCADFLRDQLH